MAVKTKVTIDHDQIKKWAEKYQGKPEVVNHSHSGSDIPSIRINFPGPEDDLFLSDGERPKKVSWNNFFKKFDDLDLAFEYEDGKTLVDPSMSYKFVKRQIVKESGGDKDGS